MNKSMEDEIMEVEQEDCKPFKTETKQRVKTVIFMEQISIMLENMIKMRYSFHTLNSSIKDTQ